MVKGIQYLNKYRSRMGLSELSYNEWLTYAAQGHSNYLNVNGKTGHYQTIGDRFWCESYGQSNLLWLLR